MQNSLEKDLDFNLDKFNNKFDKILDSEDYKDFFPAYFSDSDMSPDNTFKNKMDEVKQGNILDMSLGNIILELRDMFFIILELISKSKNPINYITSTPKRKYIFSIFLIVFGCLLLLLSTLMMENKVL